MQSLICQIHLINTCQEYSLAVDIEGYAAIKWRDTQEERCGKRPVPIGPFPWFPDPPATPENSTPWGFLQGGGGRKGVSFFLSQSLIHCGGLWYIS